MNKLICKIRSVLWIKHKGNSDKARQRVTPGCSQSKANVSEKSRDGKLSILSQRTAKTKIPAVKTGFGYLGEKLHR